MASVAKIDSVKTWKGKLDNWGTRAALGATPADLFSQMELGLIENLDANLNSNGSFDSEKAIQASAFYAVSLRTEAPKLTEVGFDPRLMGVW